MAKLVCNDSYGQATVHLTDASGKRFRYVHLHTNSVINAGITTEGVNVKMGQNLGKIHPDPPDTVAKCGYGSGPHLHLDFPSLPFTLDGVTFSSSGPAKLTKLYSTNSGVEWGGVGGAEYLGSAKLATGQIMRGSEYILSGDGRYALIMQSDGNLVLYSGTKARWNSGTGGNPGAYLVVQGDGNVVIYSSDKLPLWNTKTNDVTRFIVQRDGNIVGYSNSNAARWNKGAETSTIIKDFGGASLVSGQRLNANYYIQSGNGIYTTLMQPDGNLVLYGPGYHVLWNSKTGGHAGAFLGIQSDGNAVIYTPTYTPIWNTSTNSGYKMIMQSDSNLVFYTSDNSPVWATYTEGEL